MTSHIQNDANRTNSGNKHLAETEYNQGSRSFDKSRSEQGQDLMSEKNQ